jgi:hypothetical protein
MILGERIGGILGGIIYWGALLMGVTSLVYVGQILWGTIWGIKLMIEDPDRFDELKRQYDETMKRVDSEDK